MLTTEFKSFFNHVLQDKGLIYTLCDEINPDEGYQFSPSYAYCNSFEYLLDLLVDLGQLRKLEKGQYLTTGVRRWFIPFRFGGMNLILGDLDTLMRLVAISHILKSGEFKKVRIPIKSITLAEDISPFIDLTIEDIEMPKGDSSLCTVLLVKSVKIRKGIDTGRIVRLE